jgi:hypothetical protein
MPPGPLKSVLCSSLSGEVSKLARPVVSGLVGALSSSPPDWFKLVTMLGPGLACRIEQIPPLVRETACGLIGELLAQGKELAEGLGALAELAVKGLGSVLDAGNKILGSYHEKQGPKAYFKAYWVHYTHKAAWLKFVKGDAAMAQFVDGLHKKCRDYYDSNKPCDPMRKVFLDAVNPVVAQLKGAGAVYFDVHLRPDLLYHYLFFKNSGGKLAGFSWGGNACHLIEKFPLLEGDLQDSQPRPTVWDHACKPAFDLLLAALAQHKPQLEAQLAALGTQGCTLTSSASLYCVSYPAAAACTKALPAHHGSCVVDVGKANAAFAPQVAQQLGKRCSVVSATHATVQCARPWKVDQCKSLTASYAAQKNAPWGGKLSLHCTAAADPAFEQGKIKAIEITGQLNQKAGSAAMMAAAAGDSGAGCKPLWDALSIGCTDHKAMAKQLTALPGLAVAACPADPNKDGADAPCIVPVLTAGSAIEVVSAQQPVAAALPLSGTPATAPPAHAAQSTLPVPGARTLTTQAEPRGVLQPELGAPQGERSRVPSALAALQSPTMSTRLPPAQSPTATGGPPSSGSNAPSWGTVPGSQAAVGQTASRTATPVIADRLARGGCPPGQLAYKSGTDGLVKCIAAPACGPEQSRNAAGQCVCPAGTIAVRHGSEMDKPKCVPAEPCVAGLTRDATTGECRCPPGQMAYRSGNGVGAKCIATQPCPPGSKLDAATGKCQCPPGTRLYRDGTGGGGCVS